MSRHTEPPPVASSLCASVAARLAAAVRPAELSARRRECLRERILTRVGAVPPPGTFRIRAGDSQWRRISERVELRIVRRDKGIGRRTVMFRLQPGAMVVAHGHTQEEECLVLEGEIEIGGHLLRASARAGVVPQLATLMAAIVERSDAALAELYDLTASKLYGLARAMLGNVADAEEVVCDVYVQVWQTAPSFDAARGSVLAWLMMICRSRALDVLRQRRSRHEHVTQELPEHEAGTETRPEDMLAQFQEGTAVHRALAQLTPLRRELVALAFFKGLSHQEIAESMRLPIGTVKSHLRRSLLALREVLDA